MKHKSINPDFRKGGRLRQHHISSFNRPLAVAGFLALALVACGGPPAAPNLAGNGFANAAQTPPPQTRIEPLAFDTSAYRQAPERAKGSITVGLLLPMGDERDAIRNLAQNLYQAAQLALFDAEVTRTTNKGDFILRLHDTKGTPIGAAEAAKAALAANVDILIGPLFAASVEAVAPVLQGRPVKALAFSNDSRAAQDNLFLLGFLPEQNIDRIVSQAIAQGLTRFGALLPQGPYGARIGEQFNQSVARFGGTVVQTETYPVDAKDMFEPVKKLAQFERRTAAHAAEMARLKTEALALISPQELDDLPRDAQDAINKDALFKTLSDKAPELVSAYETLKLTETLGDIPYDAVFMPEGGLALRNLAPLLPYFDINPKRVKFIGTALWDDPSLSQEPPLHGGWFAAPDGRNWAGFAKRYARIYRTEPPRLASMAYDAVALTAQLAAQISTQPNNRASDNTKVRFANALLTNANGFAGIDGILRLREDGLNQRGLAVREITRRTPIAVSGAPTSFVAHDRRLRSAIALAESLKRENPDLAIAQETSLIAQGFVPDGEHENAPKITPKSIVERTGTKPSQPNTNQTVPADFIDAQP